MDSLHLYGLTAAGGVALLGAYALLRRKPKNPDDLERERRLVAAVEIVSPANKDRPESRQLYSTIRHSKMQ